jgi:hypothetical protein
MIDRTSSFQVRKAEFNNDVYITHFGINILTNMTEVMGRVLSAPKIQYGGRVRHFYYENHSHNVIDDCVLD